MTSQAVMGDGINRHSILDSGSGSDAGERRSVSDASTISYSTTSYRWLVLFSVFLLNLVNAAFWLTYSPISDAVATHYGVSTNVVNMLSLCLSGLYGPVVWGAAPIVKKIGFAWSVRLAAVLTGVGGIVRYFGKDHETFALLIVGQCLSGIGRPFISQLLGMVSLKWFPQRQRVLATAIAALGNPFGIGLGMGLSPMIVKTHVVSEYGDQINRLNMIHGGLGIFMMLVVFAFIRERPDVDPSEAAIADRENIDGLSFLSEVKLLWNRQYWILATAFGFGFGQLNCIAVILNQILKPFHYSRGAVGVTGIMTIMPGVIGAGLIAGFLGKRPLHREVLVGIYFLGALLLQGMMLLALGENTERDHGNYNAYLLVSAALFGFFSQPCFSVAIELASETVYPCSPAIASAGVVMMGQYFGLVMSLVFGHYLSGGTDTEKQHRVHIVGYIQSGSWIVAAFLMVLFRSDNMARIKYEKEAKDRKKQEKNDEKRRSRQQKSYETQGSDSVPESGAPPSNSSIRFADTTKSYDGERDPLV